MAVNSISKNIPVSHYQCVRKSYLFSIIPSWNNSDVAMKAGEHDFIQWCSSSVLVKVIPQFESDFVNTQHKCVDSCEY
jgi:hypothetical protein